MNSDLLFIIMTAVMLVQLVLCLRAKQTLIKWIPAFAILGLMALCGIAFAVSGNWAYIILLFLLLYVLAADGLAWILGAVWCWLRNRNEDHL